MESNASFGRYDIKDLGENFSEKYADLFKRIDEFEKEASNELSDELTKTAKKDEKPTVKGKFALPSTHLKVTDSKDHYPLNSEKEGHAALTATKKLNTLPSWFKGSLEELKSAVQKAVKKVFPKL